MSDPRPHPVRHRLSRLFSGLLVFALAAAGFTFGVAAPASAASVPQITATAAPAEGGTVTLSGSGFAGDTPGMEDGIYLGIGPVGLPGFYMGTASLVASETIWIAIGNADDDTVMGRTAHMAEDGTFSVTVTVPAPTTSIPAYAVYTSKAHGQGLGDPSQDTTTALSYAAPLPSATTTSLTADSTSAQLGDSVRLTANVVPVASGTIEFLDEGQSLAAPVTLAASAATLTVTTLGVGAHNLSARFIPADATFAASVSSPVVVTVASSTPTPSGAAISVTPATGLDPANATVTVTGTGFAVTGPGVYVGLAPASVLADPSWYLNAGYFSGTQWVRAVNADGTFSTTLSGLKQSFTSNGKTVDCGTVECGVFTFAAHGSTDRSQDSYLPVAFAKPAEHAVVTTTSIKTAAVSSTKGSALAVTVTVSPSAAGTVTIFDGNTAVARDLPVVDGVATTRLSTLSVGARSLSAAFTPTDPAAFAASTSPVVVHTVTAQQQTPPLGPVVTAPATVPASDSQPVCTAYAVNAATLQWGVKTSFRNYIAGGIANGSWTLSNVSYSSGMFAWSGGSGTYNSEADKGLVRYNGSVAFEGHEGVLSLVFSNVRVQLNSASSATLIADVVSSDMSGAKSTHANVSFASIALNGAGSSGSSLSVSGAPTTLTAAGAAAFAGFYTAGTALDPISFSLPLGATVPCDTATATALAVTGSDGGDSTALFAGLLVLAGVAAMMVARRRKLAPRSLANGTVTTAQTV